MLRYHPAVVGRRIGLSSSHGNLTVAYEPPIWVADYGYARGKDLAVGPNRELADWSHGRCFGRAPRGRTRGPVFWLGVSNCIV